MPLMEEPFLEQLSYPFARYGREAHPSLERYLKCIRRPLVEQKALVSIPLKGSEYKSCVIVHLILKSRFQPSLIIACLVITWLASLPVRMLTLLSLLKLIPLV